MKNLIERIETRLDGWGAKLEEKNIEYPVDLICGILFLVIGIVLLLIMPQQVQISEKDVVNGRAFPTMLVWLMLAMSALLVGREAYNMVMHRPTKTKTLNLLVETKALVIVLILVVTYRSKCYANCICKLVYACFQSLSGFCSILNFLCHCITPPSFFRIF